MLAFVDWKARLRKDCEVEDKLLAFNYLPDNALKIFWEMGVEPSVHALVNNGMAGRSKTTGWM